jgi:membrane protein implicated in regulation of membrane protease activity
VTALTDAGWFVGYLLIALAALRPVARAHKRSRGQIKTGTAALVGQSAIVVERIANAEGVGCVRLDGEIWTARAFIDEETFEPGARVQVLEIRGATALVSD